MSKDLVISEQTREQIKKLDPMAYNFESMLADIIKAKVADEKTGKLDPLHTFNLTFNAIEMTLMIIALEFASDNDLLGINAVQDAEILDEQTGEEVKAENADDKEYGVIV